MANTYKVIDEKNWDRAMHCAVFRNSIEPAFCVTFEIEITSFLEKIKKILTKYEDQGAHTLLTRVGTP